MDVPPASFLGAFDFTWQGVSWDATSTFNTAMGRWDVIADIGSSHSPGSISAPCAVGEPVNMIEFPGSA